MSFFKRIRYWVGSSIQRKLVFWSIGFWVLSITALSITIYTVGQTQSAKEARERNVQVASVVSRDVNVQTSAIISDVMSFSYHLELLPPDKISQADALLSFRLAAPQRFSAIYYFDSRGNLLMNLVDSQTTLLSLTGKDIASRPTIAVKQEVQDTFSAAKASATYISEVSQRTFNLDPVIYIGIPITVSSGEERVVVYEVALGDMWRRICMITVGKTGQTYAVSRNGDIIAHANPSFVGQKMPSEVSPVLRGIEGSSSYIDTSRNQRVIAAFSPVGGPVGWGIVVVQDESEAYASIIRFGSIVIIVWLGLAICGTAGIIILIRNYSRPIANLTRITETIAQTGDLTKTLLAPRSDEVGKMSRAFDQMVDRLQQSEGKIAQAAIDERNRLARDLHDAVSQTLFSASIIADVLPKIWDKHPDEGRRRLEEVRQLTRGALAEMRTLLFELRPSAMADAELGYLLRQLVESISGRTRIPITMQIEGICNPSPEVKVALYRIAQEALNNVAKHSLATQATVMMSCVNSLLILQISDNGRGFDLNTIPPDSLGLGIMRERARGFGATVSISSKPGSGTEVTVEWQENTEESAK